MKIVLGMCTRRNVAATTAGVLALTVASVAVAGNGRYANLQLGITNTINGYMTTLAGSYAYQMLQLTNSSTATYARALVANTASAVSGTIYARNSGGGPALELVVNAGKAPMKVNSAVKVTGLNADSLDDLDQSAFLRATGKAADADRLDGLDQSAFLRADANAVSATRLSSPMKYVVASETVFGPTYRVEPLVARCPPGHSPVGGGYAAVWTDPDTGEQLPAIIDTLLDAPVDADGNGTIDSWGVIFGYYDTGDNTGYVFANCAQIVAGLAPAATTASPSLTLRDLKAQTARLKGQRPGRTTR